MKNCIEAYHCGYYLWRKDRPDGHMKPLPADGDCEIPEDLCQRLHPLIPIDITAKGPQTHREMTTVFEEIPNTNGRPPRRLHGGGHG